MGRTLIVIVAALLLGVGAHAAEQTPATAVVRTALHDFRIETFVDGLVRTTTVIVGIESVSRALPGHLSNPGRGAGAAVHGLRDIRSRLVAA